jgi:hypothetical protein
VTAPEGKKLALTKSMAAWTIYNGGAGYAVESRKMIPTYSPVPAKTTVLSGTAS